MNWLLIIIAMVTMGAAVQEKGTLSELYFSSRCQDYSSLTEDEYGRAVQVFTRTLTFLDSGAPETLKEDWQGLGFQWLPVRIGKKGRGWLAREPEQECRGKGIYLFRVNGERQRVLQVPHRFKDEKTGLILLGLVKRTEAMAFAWNTIPRTAAATSDFAHGRRNYFTAMAEAYAGWQPDGTLIQIHGFSRKSRKSEAAKEYDIILSSGTKQPSSAVREMAACMGSRNIGKVGVYPFQVRELGGTTNSQGRKIRELGHGSFLHMELSRELREELTSSANLKGPFAACFTH